MQDGLYRLILSCNRDSSFGASQACARLLRDLVFLVVLFSIWFTLCQAGNTDRYVRYCLLNVHYWQPLANYKFDGLWHLGIQSILILHAME